MSKLKTLLDQDIIEALGIYQAATLDGYWEDAANKDLQYVYLLGQLQSVRSIHASYGNNGTRARIKELSKRLDDLGVRAELNDTKEESKNGNSNN